MRECYRVLKDGGKMLVISHGKPKYRKYLFRNKLVPFAVTTEILKPTKDTEVYAYICTKGEFENTRDEQ
jgi:ubiquinone/menaquinone biosynthesis C-methylase UbiE